ncbi:hypothetical protein [Nocardia sp. NPDC019255]|uniref:hypothetical protein n=1 Tax=Nocardia sp. NPDC019255 TaxID=3154591 RepID=UPI00340B2CB7
MTSSSDPRHAIGDDGDPHRGHKLYRAGPWLVLVCHGVVADAIAEIARRQCAERGVDVVVLPIDELHDLSRLGRFTGLIIIGPDTSPGTGRGADVGNRICDVVQVYRSRRGEGAAPLLAGHLPWFDVGVLQIVGRREILEHPTIKEALRQACRVHRLDEKSTPAEVDFFSIYSQYIPTGRSASARVSQLEQDLETVWDEVRAWGITTHEAVVEAYEVIEEKIKQYSNPARYSAMCRPRPDVDMNRLEIILHAPLMKPPSGPTAKKRWMENGARAVREVIAELKRRIPGLSRPGGRLGTKDQQFALHYLYANLTVLVDSPELRNRGEIE